jgi:moderate conductance mechanosensitive channel
MQIDTQFIQAAVIAWIIEHGVRVAGIIIIAYLLHSFIGRLIERLIRRLIQQGHGTKDAEIKRENTIITVANSAVGVFIVSAALLMLLSEFGIAIAPLLAAAGIAGIAFGFGGQYLIRDLISGLFILIENQYRVGDVVCFDSTCGLVETLSLRMTTLRDLDGVVHHVPHGEVKKVSNLSKQFSRVNLNIGVSYSSNLENVIKVVNEVGKALAEDAEWKDKIISPPQFLRVENFADSAIIIKILGDTQPIKQWDVTGELRKRLKIAFDSNNIEIPFPQRVIHSRISNSPPS